MAHPNDMRTDGTCRVCGDRLSQVIQKRNGKRAFRRHLTNSKCITRGQGEPIAAAEQGAPAN